MSVWTKGVMFDDFQRMTNGQWTSLDNEWFWLKRVNEVRSEDANEVKVGGQ